MITNSWSSDFTKFSELQFLFFYYFLYIYFKTHIAPVVDWKKWLFQFNKREKDRGCGVGYNHISFF